MRIPHQQAADAFIIDLSTRMPIADVRQIVEVAEALALRSGDTELTRLHLKAILGYLRFVGEKASE